MQAEREAASLRWWEPMLVPGLLQTGDYARAFIVAGFDDGAPSILYAETAVEGQTIEKSAPVRKASLAFDRLRAGALPHGASRDLIGKVAEERWTP